MKVPVELLVFAALGGFILNMMNLYQEYKRPKSERVPKDGLYWLFFVFWPFLGALLTYLLVDSGNELNGYFAFTTGLTAPTTIQSLIDKGTDSNKKPTSSEDNEEDIEIDTDE